MEGVSGSAVRDGADRFGSPTFFLNGRFDCKVSGRETDGRLCIIDTVRTHQGGPLSCSTSWNGKADQPRERNVAG